VRSTCNTTRPGLARATSVVSTQWHATWSLPRRVAEPGRITEYTHNQRGITSLSTQATTQYTYNANNLNTSITELTDGVQTQRWTLAYNTLGDLISITDATGGNQSATLTNDTQGRLTRISASNGAVASYTWNVHGQLAQDAIVANWSQHASHRSHSPIFWCQDKLLSRRNCGAEFVFTKNEQRVWYEEYKLPIQVKAVCCTTCRQRQRKEKGPAKG